MDAYTQKFRAEDLRNFDTGTFHKVLAGRMTLAVYHIRPLCRWHDSGYLSRELQRRAEQARMRWEDAHAYAVWAFGRTGKIPSYLPNSNGKKGNKN